MNLEKKTKINYIIWFSAFIIIAGIVDLTKKVLGLKDFITQTNIILVISPILFITAIVLAYALYDNTLKRIKKDPDATEEQQWEAFYKANNIKAIFFALGGTIIALTMLLIWKKDYLYLLYIVITLFFIAYPNKTKFKIAFSKYDQDKEKETEQQTEHDSEQINE